jgi:glutaredoxin
VVENDLQLPELLLRDYGIGPLAALILNYPAQHRPLTKERPMSQITVYTKPACVQCTATFTALDKRGIEYQKIDVTENREACDYVLSLGYAGRTGHSPVGHGTKLRDWVIGRDKDSDDSVTAYQRLADDIITALPPEFAPVPASVDIIDWFWRHNAWRGVFHSPPPQRPTTVGHLNGHYLPVAVYDEGDQHHHAGRPLPLRLCAAGLGAAALGAAAAGAPALAVPPAALAAAAILGWLAGLRGSPRGAPRCECPTPKASIPTATKRSCRSSTCPNRASCSPGPNSSPPSTTSTPAPPTTSQSTWSHAAANWNSCATTAPKATSTTSSSSAATSATATPN